MGAPAISTRARPAVKPRNVPRRRPTVAAVGRTAGAVGGIADSGMVVGMTRGRVWIVVLGILLGGIVALNVWGLGMSSSSSATAAKIDALQRDNSVLGGRIANRLSNGMVEATAAKLGLAVPAADAVHYLDGGSANAERAAERLANGKIALSPPAAPAVEEILDPNAVLVVADPAVAPVDPAAVVPVTPVEPAPVEPVATETTVAAAPAAPVASAPVSGAVTP